MADSEFRPTVALVQARMGSSRFPGKMMADLCGYPVIRWVLERCRGAAELDNVVLCTTQSARDDVLEAVAVDLSIDTYRGSEHDVLGRFTEAARAHEAKTIVRVCADNPLVAPEAIDRVVAVFENCEADYAFNHVPRMGANFADGLGVEVFSRQLLEEMNARAQSADEREHVTRYVWKNADSFALLVVDFPAEWNCNQINEPLDVDVPGDLARLSEICAGLSLDATIPQIVARCNQI